MTNWIDSQMTQSQTNGQVFSGKKCQQDRNSATPLESVCLWQQPCSHTASKSLWQLLKKSEII